MPKAIAQRARIRTKELLESGASTREAAKETGVSQSYASRLLRSVRPYNANTKIGCLNALSEPEVRYICNLALMGKCSTAAQITHELDMYLGVRASAKTVLRTLNKNGVSFAKGKQPG